METIELTQWAEKVLTVIDGIGPDAVNLKTVQKNSGLDRMYALSGLLELELYGIIKQLPGKYFIRKGAAK
jgi:predicted Rossmann fold nucleotide-binding protein DprA/Smf involved in DNA uptake